jgi:hypothetical protein
VATKPSEIPRTSLSKPLAECMVALINSAGIALMARDIPAQKVA